MTNLADITFGFGTFGCHDFKISTFRSRILAFGGEKWVEAVKYHPSELQSGHGYTKREFCASDQIDVGALDRRMEPLGLKRRPTWMYQNLRP